MPVELRCDWMVDPLGVDSAPPRLSGKLQGDGTRGLRQSAWQVLVPSSREGSAARPGRRLGQRARRVRRAAPRAVRRPCPALGRAGLLEGEGLGRRGPRLGLEQRPPPGRWACSRPAIGSAQWITDPGLLRWVRPLLGLSLRGDGRRRAPSSGSRWTSARPTPSRRCASTRCATPWPEGSGSRTVQGRGRRAGPTSRTPRCVADHTAREYDAWTCTSSGSRRGRRRRATSGSPPRALRVVDGKACLGPEPDRGDLGREERRRRRAAVTASDSVEQPPWSARRSRTASGAPGANPRANGTLLLRREFLR